LCLEKVVINDNGGTASETDWTLSASGPTPCSGTSVVCCDVDAGTYTLSETGPSAYTAGNWVCTGDGSQSGNTITLGNGEYAICTITNDDEFMPGEEICRTAGFWGSHAGDEKGEKSQNITQEVIDYIGGCVEICGEIITTTEVDDAESALEALCVSPRGYQKLQLARQLMAMALNCIISGGGPKCQNMSIEDLFSECNEICAGITSGNVGQCIEMVDSWNNGYYNGCHSRRLCSTANDLCFEDPPYVKPGPAGSPKACRAARKNDCTIIMPGESECEVGWITDDDLEMCQGP
jgi:hypothetical protein